MVAAPPDQDLALALAPESPGGSDVVEWDPNTRRDATVFKCAELAHLVSADPVAAASFNAYFNDTVSKAGVFRELSALLGACFLKVRHAGYVGRTMGPQTVLPWDRPDGEPLPQYNPATGGTNTAKVVMFLINLIGAPSYGKSSTALAVAEALSSCVIRVDMNLAGKNADGRIHKVFEAAGVKLRKWLDDYGKFLSNGVTVADAELVADAKGHRPGLPAVGPCLMLDEFDKANATALNAVQMLFEEQALLVPSTVSPSGKLSFPSNVICPVIIVSNPKPELADEVQEFGKAQFSTTAKAGNTPNVKVDPAANTVDVSGALAYAESERALRLGQSILRATLPGPIHQRASFGFLCCVPAEAELSAGTLGRMVDAFCMSVKRPFSELPDDTRPERVRIFFSQTSLHKSIVTALEDGNEEAQLNNRVADAIMRTRGGDLGKAAAVAWTAAVSAGHRDAGDTLVLRVNTLRTNGRDAVRLRQPGGSPAGPVYDTPPAAPPPAPPQHGPHGRARARLSASAAFVEAASTEATASSYLMALPAAAPVVPQLRATGQLAQALHRLRCVGRNATARPEHKNEHHVILGVSSATPELLLRVHGWTAASEAGFAVLDGLCCFVDAFLVDRAGRPVTAGFSPGCRLEVVVHAEPLAEDGLCSLDSCVVGHSTFRVGADAERVRRTKLAVEVIAATAAGHLALWKENVLGHLRALHDSAPPSADRGKVAGTAAMAKHVPIILRDAPDAEFVTVSAGLSYIVGDDGSAFWDALRNPLSYALPAPPAAPAAPAAPVAPAPAGARAPAAVPTRAAAAAAAAPTREVTEEQRIAEAQRQCASAVAAGAPHAHPYGAHPGSSRGAPAAAPRL